jgi:hypothetical protein
MFDKCELPLKADGAHILAEATGQMLRSLKPAGFPEFIPIYIEHDLNIQLEPS